MKTMSLDLPRVCAVILAIGAQGAYAQAAVSQSSASIYNLKASVIDLDPNDGVAPQVDFVSATGAGQLSVLKQGNYNQTLGWSQSVDPMPFSTGASSVVLREDPAAASASANGHGISASVSLSQQDTKAFVENFSHINGKRHSLQAKGYNNDERTVTGTEHNFVLAPHTTLVLEGSIDLAFVNDPSNADFTSMQSKAEFQTTRFELGINSGASLSFELRDTDPQNQSLWSFFKQETSHRYGITAQGVQYLEGQGSPIQQNFQLTISNTSDVARIGRLTYGVSTETYIQSWSVAGVPEPTTWATFGLGLSGLAFAANRQRQLKTSA